MGLHLKVFLLALFFCQRSLSLTIVPEVIDGEVGVLYSNSTNSAREVIYQFTNVFESSIGKPTSLRLKTVSRDATLADPLTIVVRQKRDIISWQIPLVVRGSTSVVHKYSAVNRTLCPTTQVWTEYTLEGNSDDSLYVTVSTSSYQKVSFQLMVFRQEEFLVEFDQSYSAVVSPSAPIFYQLQIPEDVGVGILRLRSEDNLCMTLSIQNLTCPVHDLVSTVEYEGIYESVLRQGGISFSRDEFPLGLFIVLIVRPDDSLCTGMPVNGSNYDESRKKLVEFSITRKISLDEYLQATFGAFFIFLSAYFGVVLISCIGFINRRCHNSRSTPQERRPLLVNLEAGPSTADEPNVTVQHVTADVHGGGDELVSNRSRRSNYGSVEVDNVSDPSREIQDESELIVAQETRTLTTTYARSDDSSLDEWDIDLLEDMDVEKDIFRTKSRLFVADLSRKNSRILAKKANLYQWNLLTIATFYGLPVVQLVLTYQNVTNTTGNLDICYFNFLCAQKLGLVSDFNHIFSNLGYVMLGTLFIIIAYRKDRQHRKELQLDPGKEKLGIPQHFGMYYAMGIGLVIEGIMSGCYHVCPNHTNFQFDTAFMYTISILILLKIYQTRHPDINANAYTAFGVLAFIILISTIGVLKGSLIFWIFFTSLHIISCLVLSVNIYYMGRWKLNAGIFKRMWLIGYNDIRSLCGGHWYALKPLYVDRMILLLVLNAANWGLSGYGVFALGHSDDFASFLLAVFISNVMLYTMFYIVMKIRHKEKITLQPAIYILLSTITWIGAMFFFFNKSTTWTHTPAQSREFNQECNLFHFYDNHDIWHFLSAASLFFSFMILLTLDDDLVSVPRDKIPVF